jgi:hypothetical protein
MMKTLLLTSVAGLALCVASAVQAGPGENAVGAHGNGRAALHDAPPKGAKVLYDQNSGTGSQAFFSDSLGFWPQNDDYLADDFTVPAGHSWRVKEVDVTGYYWDGPGPASSVNVLFWNDASGLPSTEPRIECDNLTPRAGLDSGSFQIQLPTSCKVNLKGGGSGANYWVTVQANMSGLYTSGFWAWQTNAIVVNNNLAAGDWYNIQNIGPPCDGAWASLETCTGYDLVLAFALRGKDAS